MKQVIELIRVSTESQAGQDRASIPAQRAINRRTAAAYGLTIVRSIEISDVSGAAVLRAPEIQQLLTLMERPEIHGVVAREFSRLMRPENFADYALLQAFADTNTVLYLPEGPIDFSSKTGRFMGTIRAAMAGMERVEILERIFGAKEEKRRQGGFAQSKVCLPFGVKYEDGWHYTDDAERVREAFRLFLSGETCYTEIGRKVGIEPYSLRVMLRNPIYSGWRVIDKRRDPSPAGKYATKDGRQGDRRKIARAPEDVIRKKVIDDPLVSENDFARVQQMMDLKKARYWRTRGDDHRFTYNGFLTCSVCRSLIYTKYRRKDYYLCKKGKGCITRYMRRETLEPQLDKLFTEQLTDPTFLNRTFKNVEKKKPGARIDRLTGKLETLQKKRERVLESYYEGVINPIERDTKLTEIERDRQVVSDLLATERPDVSVNLDGLAEVFTPFVEFDLLNRDQKRRLLNTIAPEVLVADYKISGLFISPVVSHTDMGSSRPLT
jgi:DNA invertase Pin-like site-specific DNA recombinase